MRRALLLPLLIAGCAGLKPTSVYTGTTTPASGTCDSPTVATLTIHGADILFAPSSGTILLNGQESGPTIAADTTLMGADKKPYRLAFSGTLKGAAIVGTYATPRCRYSVALTLTRE